MKGSKKLVAIIASVVAVFIVVILVIMAMKSARATELSPHATEDGKEMIESLKAEESKAEPKAEPSKVESKVAESKTEPSVAKADSTDAPKETTLEDPYGMYVVTEEWLSDKNIIYVVNRNNKLYSLGNLVMGGVPEKYNIGYEKITRTNLYTKLYMYDNNKKNDIPTNLKSRLVTSSGDFPIFQVSKTEEIRIYSNNTTVKDVKFISAKFYGYTLNATHAHGITTKGSIYTPILDHVYPHEDAIDGDDPSVCYLDNNDSVTDVYNLEYGQKYNYGYFEGNKFNEITLTADCKCYSLDDTKKTKLSTKRTKNGYSVIDISGLEPGIYYQENVDLLFEVVD